MYMVFSLKKFILVGIVLVSSLTGVLKSCFQSGTVQDIMFINLLD